MRAHDDSSGRVVRRCGWRSMTRKAAADELRALAELIERPPLDDVLLSQDVALRAAEAIGLVLNPSPQEEGDEGAIARIIDPDEFRYHAALLDYCIGCGDSPKDARETADAMHGLGIATATAKARTIRSLLEAPSPALIRAAEEALAWHESEDKALSKQPSTPDRQWHRMQHQEQIAALSAPLRHPHLRDRPAWRGGGMRVLVCGGRDYREHGTVWQVLGDLHMRRPIDVLIEGGATGADRWCAKWAKCQHGVEIETYPADWSAHGKAAGPIRNQRMIDEGKPDLVVAFPGGRGTADMARRAKAAGVEVIEISHPASNARQDEGTVV